MFIVNSDEGMHQLEGTAVQQETPWLNVSFVFHSIHRPAPLTSVLARMEALANQYARVGLTNAQKQLKRKMVAWYSRGIAPAKRAADSSGVREVFRLYGEG